MNYIIELLLINFECKKKASYHSGKIYVNWRDLRNEFSSKVSISGAKFIGHSLKVKGNRDLFFNSCVKIKYKLNLKILTLNYMIFHNMIG